MTNDPLFLLVALAILITLAVLLFGVGTFGRGGAFNRRNSNKIMRWRIIAQAVAIVLILIFVFFRRSGG
ncbi:MAG: twin transmembrane helix small protein [Celeribacter sp.]|jgi:hypothetical protein